MGNREQRRRKLAARRAHQRQQSEARHEASGATPVMTVIDEGTRFWPVPVPMLQLPPDPAAPVYDQLADLTRVPVIWGLDWQGWGMTHPEFAEAAGRAEPVDPGLAAVMHQPTALHRVVADRGPYASQFDDTAVFPPVA